VGGDLAYNLARRQTTALIGGADYTKTLVPAIGGGMLAASLAA